LPFSQVVNWDRMMVKGDVYVVGRCIMCIYMQNELDATDIPGCLTPQFVLSPGCTLGALTLNYLHLVETLSTFCNNLSLFN